MSYSFLLKKNNAKSILNGNISAGATALIVASASKFPATGSFLCTIWDKVSFPDPSDDPNMEIVLVTSVSSFTFTITRAQETTTGVGHFNGNAIEMLCTAGILKELEDQINTKLDELVGDFCIIGDGISDGSWKISASGSNLVFQRLESGVWVDKNYITA